MGKRELIALLNLSSWCLVMVERLFLTVPRGYLQFVIVLFPDHTHLLFLNALYMRIIINKFRRILSLNSALIKCPWNKLIYTIVNDRERETLWNYLSSVLAAIRKLIISPGSANFIFWANNSYHPWNTSLVGHAICLSYQGDHPGQTPPTDNVSMYLKRKLGLACCARHKGCALFHIITSNLMFPYFQ